MTFGAQFAEVEVDTWTGVVRVIRLTAVHDVGRVINPLLARSQLEGGIIQGLGFALFEERIIDERLGLPLNAGLHDYKVPTMADIPEIDATCLDAVDSVANPVAKLTGAIHIYGGDFFAGGRTEWDPETLVPRPWSIQGAVRQFEESNARFFGAAGAGCDKAGTA